MRRDVREGRPAHRVTPPDAAHGRSAGSGRRAAPLSDPPRHAGRRTAARCPVSEPAARRGATRGTARRKDPAAPRRVSRSGSATAPRIRARGDRRRPDSHSSKSPPGWPDRGTSVQRRGTRRLHRTPGGALKILGRRAGKDPRPAFRGRLREPRKESGGGAGQPCRGLPSTHTREASPEQAPSFPPPRLGGREEGKRLKAAGGFSHAAARFR